MLSLKLDTDAFERRLIAVLGPIPDTSIKFKKNPKIQERYDLEGYLYEKMDKITSSIFDFDGPSLEYLKLYKPKDGIVDYNNYGFSYSDDTHSEFMHFIYGALLGGEYLEDPYSPIILEALKHFEENNLWSVEDGIKYNLD